MKPGVSGTVGLLEGTDGNDDRQNADDIKRYLPSQLSQLQSAVSSCLTQAQQLDDQFADLLNLTMEIHESCTATKGTNQALTRDAEMRTAILALQKNAVNESKDLDKSLSAEATKTFNDVSDETC